MKNPCYRCEERKLYCHSQCKDYKEWKAESKTRDKEECQYLDYVTQAIGRMKGNGRWG